MSAKEKSPNELGRIEQSDLEKLRGPNSTLKLVNLIEEFVRDIALDEWTENFSSREFDSQIASPIMKLQQWVRPINQKVVKVQILYSL